MKHSSILSFIANVGYGISTGMVISLFLLIQSGHQDLSTKILMPPLAFIASQSFGITLAKMMLFQNKTKNS